MLLRGRVAWLVWAVTLVGPQEAVLVSGAEAFEATFGGPRCRKLEMCFDEARQAGRLGAAQPVAQRRWVRTRLVVEACYVRPSASVGRAQFQLVEPCLEARRRPLREALVGAVLHVARLEHPLNEQGRGCSCDMAWLVLGFFAASAAARCVTLVAVEEGVDLGPLKGALDGESSVVPSLHEAAKKCVTATVLREPGARSAASLVPIVDALRRRQRRELRMLRSSFDAVGIVEEPKASAALFDAVAPLRNDSWYPYFQDVAAANPWRSTGRSIDPDEDALYQDALATLRQGTSRSTASCRPTAARLLWLHSYGYAPLEPIHGEGLNGWRIIFARVLAIAKRLNASVVLPCARHSILVPCGVTGSLALRDPVGNSGDDDFVEDSVREAGVHPQMRKWLELEGIPETQDYEDDASRGVPYKTDDASAYFDLDAIDSYLGYAAVPVECVDGDVTYIRAKDSTLDDIDAAFARARIVKFGGGFSLATLRDTISRDQVAAVEAGPLFRFAPRLHEAALDFKRLLGKPLAVLHWRAETLIARQDALRTRMFEACAANLKEAATTYLRRGFAVALVTDIPYSDDRPLWTSYANKLKGPRPDIRKFVADMLDLGVAKYDAFARHAAVDLGDVAVIDQILAVEAEVLETHYATDNDVLEQWSGVSFNDCGYAGRFMRTIVTKRLHLNATVRSWYPAAGFPNFRSPSQRRTNPPRGGVVADQD